jgi:hypothetical protein
VKQLCLACSKFLKPTALSNQKYTIHLDHLLWPTNLKTKIAFLRNQFSKQTTSLLMKYPATAGYFFNQTRTFRSIMDTFRTFRSTHVTMSPYELQRVQRHGTWTSEQSHNSVYTMECNDRVDTRWNIVIHEQSECYHVQTTRSVCAVL